MFVQLNLQCTACSKSQLYFESNHSAYSKVYGVHHKIQ